MEDPKDFVWHPQFREACEQIRTNPESILLSRIEWEGLNGVAVITNAVPFWYIVHCEAASLSDKTWRRWRGWCEKFHQWCATHTQRSQIESISNIVAALPSRISFAKPKYCLVKLYSPYFKIFLEYGLNEELTPRPAALLEEQYYVGPALVQYHLFVLGTGWGEVLLAPFKVYLEDKLLFHYETPTISDSAAIVMNDWAIIHHLAGQAERRAFRIGIASEYGSMMSHLFPPPPSSVSRSAILAVMESSFSPAKRGGYITKEFGKYCLSPVKESGFYRVVKERPNVKVLALLEPYKVLQALPHPSRSPWLCQGGWTLAPVHPSP